jgi:DNA helicase-2/ATP-dependent DNA helicase PcrA
MISPATFRLSEEQQAIVDYPLRPLRVSAGAGTGKTTTVSYRMARLVAEEGIQPEQILGLTFTNKAAQELSQKIRQVLAETGRPDPLRDVQVNTYHGFCSQIVTEFGALLSIERNLAIIGPAQTRQLVKMVIRETPLPGLDNTDLFYLPGTIIRLASALADHLRDPDLISEGMLRPRLPDLVRSDFVRKKDFDGYQRLVTTSQKREGMVEAVRRYQDHKRRLGVVDYGDLISQAHQILHTEPEIARHIGARYRAVVADEYQDTNAAQRVILQKLFGEGFPLTVVGDSDQTLYEWRGASLQNFADFPRHFPRGSGRPSETLPLTLNRRSGRRIIRFANRIKQEIGSATKDLQALPAAKASSITATWHSTFNEEAVWIAEQLRERHKAGRKWREMAVLFRKTKDIMGVYRQLVAHDIPVDVANLGGLLSTPEVVEIHSWLKVIGRFDDREAAARLLGGTRYRLGLGDIRHLSRFAYRPRDGKPRALLDGLDDKRFWENLPDHLTDSYRRFDREYRHLLSFCQANAADEACRIIMQRTRAWADVESMSDSARLSARLNLYSFLDLAKNWMPLEGHSTIAGFLDYLDALLEEPAEEVDTARLSDEDAVALLTVHKAKGLEWPVVFIPAIYNGNFPSRVVNGYDNPFRKAETVPWDWRIDPPDHVPITTRVDAESLTAFLKDRDDEARRAHFSQEWRIAYVAATRAKEELLLSGAHWYGHPEPTVKPQLPHQSEFFKAAWVTTLKSPPSDPDRALEEMFPSPDRPETFAVPVQAASSPDPLFGEGGWPAGIHRGLDDPQTLADIARQSGFEEEYQQALEDYQGMLFHLPDPSPDDRPVTVTTSATDLVSYAQCPKKYYWTRVEPLPRRYSYLTRRGTRIHRQIELHHQDKVSLLEPEDSESAVIDLTGDDRPVDSPTAKGPFQVFLDSRFSKMEARWLEKAFTLRLGDKFWVRGRIDAVYQKGPDSWEVVDFKSGRPPADDPHSARQAQMQVYGLAVKDIPELGPAPSEVSVTIAYLGGGRLRERPASVPVDKAWLASARRRLEAMARSIIEEQWSPTPSMECKTCDFFHLCPEGKRFISSIGKKTC